MTEDFMKKTFVVKNGDEEFTFKNPTIHEDIATGLRARKIRQALVGPDGDASEDGVDWFTSYLCRACAVFELLLQAGPKWCWTKVPTAQIPQPQCDTSLLGPEYSERLVTIYQDYRNQLDSFRAGGNPVKPPLSKEAVAS